MSLNTIEEVNAKLDSINANPAQRKTIIAEWESRDATLPISKSLQAKKEDLPSMEFVDQKTDFANQMYRPSMWGGETLIDPDLFKNKILKNPKYKGVSVDSGDKADTNYGRKKNTTIRTADGKVFGTDKESLTNFDKYMASRTKEQQRLDVALGNISGGYNGFNNSKRFQELGYEVQWLDKHSSSASGERYNFKTGEGGSWSGKKYGRGKTEMRLMKNGIEVPMTDISEENIMGHLYNNITDEELLRVEALNTQDQEAYLNAQAFEKDQAMMRFGDNQVTADYNESPAFKNRFLDDAKDNGFSDAGLEILDKFIKNEGNPSNALDEIVTALEPQDQRALNQTLLVRKANKTYDKGKKEFYDGMINTRVESMMTSYYDDIKDTGGIMAGAESQKLTLENKKESLNLEFKALEARGNEIAEKNQAWMSDISGDAEKMNVGIGLSGGRYYAEGGSIENNKEVSARLKELNASIERNSNTFEKDRSRMVENHGKYLLEEDLLYSQNDLTSREFGDWNSFVTRMGGFERIALAVPTLLGSTGAVERRKEIQEEVSTVLKKAGDYQEALASGEMFSYLVANAGDQLPNMASAMVATYFGGPLGSPILFGIDSAASSWVETDTLEKAGNKAQKDLIELEKIKDKLDYDDYKKHKIALQTQISAGDLSPMQRYTAATFSGAIEFGIQFGLGKIGLGTSGWAGKMVGRTATASTRELGEAVFTSNWKALGNFGKQTLIDQAGELVEELSIEGLTEISNAYVLGRDLDFSQLDDVAVSTIATGGMMATGNAHTAVVNQYSTKEIRAKGSEAFAEIKTIRERMSTLSSDKKNDTYRQQLKAQLLSKMEVFGDLTAEMEVAAMIGGADNLKNVLKNNLNLQGLDTEAGILPGDNVDIQQEKREAHVETLTKSEKEDYQNRRDQATEEQARLVEVDYNESSIEELYGPAGLKMEERLKSKKGFPSDKKSQMVMIHRALQKQAVDRNVRYYKKQDKLRGNNAQAMINQTLYGDEKWSGKRNKKAENMIWQDMGKNLLIRQATATSLYRDGGKSINSMLSEKELADITYVQVEDVAELEARMEESSLSAEEKRENVRKLRNGEVRGLIVDGKYITTDAKSAKTALKEGDILQGTVIAHEISHAIDDLAMGQDELINYAGLLEGEIKKEYSAVDQIAKQRLAMEKGSDGKPLYDPSLPFEEQSAQGKDEYARAVQEVFQGDRNSPFSKKLRKSSQGLRNKLAGVVNADYKFRKGTDATFYMSQFIENFEGGRISDVAKRKIKARKGKSNTTGTKESSNFKGILSDFKTKEKISSDIKKTDKGAKRKLVNQLMIGAESKVEGVPFNLQKSKLAQEAGGIVESITQRLFDGIPDSELNNVTRKDYKDRLVTDLSTLIINEYEEVSIVKGKKVKNSLDTFISSRLNARANAVAKSMGIESSIDFGGAGFKVGLDKAKNVTNEDNNDTPAQTQEKQILSLRRKLGIQKGSDLYNEIIDGVLTNLVTAGDINSAGFKKKLMDGFADAYVNKIKKLIGTPKSATYKKFLNETASGVYSKMSLQTLNQRFQYFTEAVIDDSGKQKRKNVEKSDKDLKVKSKTAGNAEFTKKPATKQVLEDWVNYFLNPQSVTPGVGRADSRRTSISEAIGVELGFDAMMEVLENPETFEKFKALAEFRGFEVSDNYLSLLSKVIDRSPGTKFSSKSGDALFDNISKQNSITQLRNFLEENKATEGVDIIPLLDEWVKTVSPGAQNFIAPHVSKIKGIYKKQGKTVTMKEFRESLTESQLLAGQSLGFDFFNGFDSMVDKIGGQKRIDTTTEAGRIEYLRHVGDFTNILDPEFLKISMLHQTFTGSSNLSKDGLRFSESKKKMVQDSFKTKDVKSKYKKNKKYQGEFKGDKKLIKPINTAVEDKMLALVKKMPDNPTPAEVKALSNELNTIITPAKRKAIQQTRDYFYTKLNDYINDPSTYDGGVINEKERLSRLAYVSTLLQAQTSSSSGIARQGAVVSSITLDYSKTQKRAVTGKDRPYQSEHNIQLLNFNGNVLKSIVKGNFDVAYPIVSSKYNQTLLDADAQSVLDSKEGKLSKEFVDKYGVRNLADYIGKTTGAPGFIAGMDSESMFVVALGNASRTVDLKTGLTMDQVIYNKINANKSLDYLDGVANQIKSKIGNTESSRTVLSNKSTVFGDATNTDLFDNIITKSILGVDPKSDVFMLAQRIDNKEDYDKVRKANDNILIDYGLANKRQLKNLTEVEKIEKLKTVDKATKFSRKADVNPLGMSTFDFDETAGISDNFVIAKKDGKTQRIASDQWPVIGDQMVKDGWKMDFSDFNKVTNGRPGPLMQKLKNQIKKYGNKNVFILTARAAESAPAIKAYLESEGVSLPIENITGLGNSTGEAKAMWMLEKFAEGYNDMYFVDDALPNVKAVKGVLSQLDIKSKVVQTKFSGKADLDSDFNNIIEQTKSIKKEARYSDALAKTKGASIGKYQFFLPPSAEDFEGLMYPLLGKGKVGDAQKQWFNKHLFQPFARANRDINSAKQRVANEYRGLKKQNSSARKKLSKKIPGTSFTFDHAVRVYLWNKAGFEIPGLSKRDQVALKKAIDENPDVKAFSDQLGVISQQEAGYTKPSLNWVVETIASDLNNITQKVGRKAHLAEWIENKNVIFSKENLNKLESIYGSRYREALEDMLYRMENGTNRSSGSSSRLVNNYSNWVNNSVGAIMFFNGRSAVLQTLSTINFINWSDNNPLKAAAAFANQPQYWSDFVMIFNSDMLKQRRSGLKTDVNQAELAQALSGQTNKAKAALNYLLKIGFTPTQIADSFAISAGGSTFYRNRVKTYLDQGMDQKAAETQAFEDFQEIAEKTQQSSRADMISQQQASPLGRLILAFQNTPMQYTRLIKKATMDLANGRGDWKTNVSRIIYYGAVQNFIFSALQSALFATIFGAEDDEEELDNKKTRIANTMIDSILRGSGLAGAAISTVKNIIMTFMKQEEKGFMADHTYTVLQAINLSPPIGSKARKLYSGIQTWRFNKDVIKHKGFSLDNPAWNGLGNVIDAATNVPVGRVVQKLNNVSEALDSENKTWQRIALMLGWNTWDLGVEDEDLNVLRKELKKAKKKSKKKKKKTISTVDFMALEKKRKQSNK